MFLEEIQESKMQLEKKDFNPHDELRKIWAAGTAGTAGGEKDCPKPKPCKSQKGAKSKGGRNGEEEQDKQYKLNPKKAKRSIFDPPTHQVPNKLPEFYQNNYKNQLSADQKHCEEQRKAIQDQAVLIKGLGLDSEFFHGHDRLLLQDQVTLKSKPPNPQHQQISNSRPFTTRKLSQKEIEAIIKRQKDTQNFNNYFNNYIAQDPAASNRLEVASQPAGLGSLKGKQFPPRTSKEHQRQRQSEKKIFKNQQIQ